MICKDRNGNIIAQNETQNKAIRFLYQTKFGRGLLKLLIRPGITHIGGFFMNTKVSTLWIMPFVKKNQIDLNEYERQTFRSYNDFFTRKIQLKYRPVDHTENHLISPCDSKLSAYKIEKNRTFCIKNTEYQLSQLLKNEALANQYENGTLLIFRLTVDDYHRYCYVDSGTKDNNIIIQGVFHTVNPLANDVYPIYKENSREYSILHSDHFDDVIMMEVGALMVGKIVNYHQEAVVARGQEKGKFEFGGSTVILCFKENQISLDADILENSRQFIETKVKYGEKIGVKRHA